jgi:hypothetical protein
MGREGVIPSGAKETMAARVILSGAKETMTAHGLLRSAQDDIMTT